MKQKFLLSLIVVCIFNFYSTAGKTILPNDPNIQYVGRFDLTNPLSPKISWTGTQIIANFRGTSLKMIMNSAPNTYYDAIVDGILYVVPLKDGNLTYDIVKGLVDTVHNVVLFKRDSPWNPQHFNGFILDDGKQLTTPPSRKVRKIDFYGDSLTQGAQDEVPGSGVDLGPLSYDNNYFSYDAIAARLLNAEFTCIAECGASLTSYPIRKNIPDYYDKTGMGTDYSIWNFNSWQAEVVCINLGTNDQPFPTTFSSKCLSFVQVLRGKYPNAFIYLLSGPMYCSPELKKATALAVDSLKRLGDNKVYYYAFKQTLNHGGHPRIAEHEGCAKELVTEITKVIWGNKN